MTSNSLAVDELSTALRCHLTIASQPKSGDSTNKSSGEKSSSKSAETSNKKEKKQKAPVEKHDASEQTVVKETTQHKNLDQAPTKEPAYDRWTLRDPESINYGYLAQTKGQGVEDASSSFYLTTAINYTNGPAHMGHAYEAVTSDVIVRCRRLQGKSSVFFCTGADEHGQKIANTAADQNQQPIDICDKYVTGFQVLNQRLLIANDEYVRTTSERHKRTARELWKKCNEAGDIYLDTYSGWYNIREETFVTDSEAALSEYKDPTSGAPLKKVEEESYFFRMSKYKDQLINYIENVNPQFICPEKHKNLILQRLKSDDLRDLSISRTTFSWGISVPEGFNANHVMYVWVDALSNYLTGIDALQIESNATNLHKFWPANVHIIGKDILWFHTVIWPCLLMSAGIPLPKAVFAHGFVNDKEGKKMSKSLGNVVDPHDMLDHYSVDTFRWYLCKESAFGGELSFSEDSMRDMHNADLCDTIGNLVHRATNLCQKYCDGLVPDAALADPFPINLKEIVDSFDAKVESMDLQGAAQVAILGFRDVNGYLQEAAPWALKGDEHTQARQVIVRTVLETIYALSHLLLPFLPCKLSTVFEKLRTEPVPLAKLNRNCINLTVGTKVDIGDVLYEKALSEEEKQKTASASTKKKESHLEAQKRKKEEKAKAIAKSKQGSDDGGNDPNQPEFTKLEIRVGKITKVWDHEKADKLYCEQVDLGEQGGGIREIASGLRSFYSLDEMQDKLVLVVCNLKPQKMLDFMSNGMVLAAKSAEGDKVELIEPPVGASLGERVYIDGLSGEPQSSAQVKKRKVFESVAKDLQTGDGGVAMWSGKPILTKSGPCKAASLVGAPIS